MRQLLLFAFCLVICVSCAEIPEKESQETGASKRAQALMQDKKHTELCRLVFDEFRKDALIGMTSKQFGGAVNTKWVEQAHIIPILYLGGEIPISFGPGSSICYCVHLYPNGDDWSNYVIYFRISKPVDLALKEYTDFGRRYLLGKLKQESVVLEEFALCPPGKTLQEGAPIERFPSRATKTQFKGVELYSWQSEGQPWTFSILPGTNRIKTPMQISDPRVIVIGIANLKARLARMAKGEQIFWHNRGRKPVPQKIVKDLTSFCDDLDIKLHQL